MDITSYLLGKKSSGGGPSGDKYTPKHISFTNYDGTDLEYETKNLDTKNITTMKEMFNNCFNLTKIDLTGWDTKNVTTMNKMFYCCMGLLEIDVSSFDTSKVTDMSYMFYLRGTSAPQCSKIVFGDNFDTSKVTNMQSMFGATNLVDADFSKFDFSSVTTLQSFFYTSTANKLSDDTLNSLLLALQTATSVETKTLKSIGLPSSKATKCTTLSNWPALVALGWTTGW